MFTASDSARYGALMDAWKASAAMAKAKQLEATAAFDASRNGSGSGPSDLLLRECERLQAQQAMDWEALDAFMKDFLS